tara:strand:- start:375 stop:1100 length:726 start_codon:yes stop_codon:yes gene_type:complete
MNIGPPNLLDAFKLFGTRLFTVAKDHPNAEVPACPGWNMSDLVSHVGSVYGAVEQVISLDSTDRPSVPFPTPPDQEVLNWARNNFQNLTHIFSDIAPVHPIWTWGREQNVGWFVRRMAHETLVHMWDAETSAQEHISVDGDIAMDGINEFIDGPLQFSLRPDIELFYPNGSVHLHRTDGDGEWLLQPTTHGLSVRYAHEKGDIAVRGSAMNLLLYLWGRHPQEIETFGDEVLVAEWAQQAP